MHAIWKGLFYPVFYYFQILTWKFGKSKIAWIVFRDIVDTEVFSTEEWTDMSSYSVGQVESLGNIRALLANLIIHR